MNAKGLKRSELGTLERGRGAGICRREGEGSHEVWKPAWGRPQRLWGKVTEQEGHYVTFVLRHPSTAVLKTDSGQQEGKQETSLL